MVTGDEEIKYGYLLDPCFQMVNTAGKPLTSGWIEVYIAGTRNKYYCSSDFAGTLHPFKIPLDSLGSNIILADVEKSYDVYVYNKFGNLTMSRYNITPGKGGAGGSISGSGIAEHWIGKNGQNTSVPAGSDTALKLPTSFEYEGSFIDRINENRTAFYLKEGLYLVQAVVNFKQSDQSLTNEISQVDVFTRSDDAPEDMSFNRDMAGPDSSDDSHCLKVSFIRCVKEDDEISQIVLFKVNTPNAWSECYLQNVQIARLSSGGAGAGGATYTAGDYISIDEETNTISVTGIDPDSYATHDEVEQAIESATSAFITSADLPDLSSYATEQWVLDKHYITSADIPDIPDDLVTSAELAQTSGLIEQDIADLTSAISEALADKMDKSSSADFYPRYDNPEGYLTSIPSEYVTESEMSTYVTEHTSAFITSADIPPIPEDLVTSGELANVSAEIVAQIPSLDGYATEQYVHDYTSGFITSADLPDVSDMATKTWVTDQHYITSADVPPQVEYSAGDNIDITNHVVSVTDTSQLIAGDNVIITPSGNDYIISARASGSSGYVTRPEMDQAIDAAVSGKQDTLTFGYDSDENITTIDGHGIAGNGGSTYLPGQYISIDDYVITATGLQPSGDYLEPSDLNGYATEEYVTEHTSAFITSADIPDLPEDLVTSGELATVSGEIVNQIPSLQGYATEEYVTEQTSAFVDSAYVSEYVTSQTSGKQDTLTFEYNAESAISAINGSAIADISNVTTEEGQFTVHPNLNGADVTVIYPTDVAPVSAFYDLNAQYDDSLSNRTGPSVYYYVFKSPGYDNDTWSANEGDVIQLKVREAIQGVGSIMGFYSSNNSPAVANGPTINYPSSSPLVSGTGSQFTISPGVYTVALGSNPAGSSYGKYICLMISKGSSGTYVDDILNKIEFTFGRPNSDLGATVNLSRYYLGNTVNTSTLSPELACQLNVDPTTKQQKVYLPGYMPSSWTSRVAQYVEYGSNRFNPGGYTTSQQYIAYKQYSNPTRYQYAICTDLDWTNKKMTFLSYNESGVAIEKWTVDYSNYSTNVWTTTSLNGVSEQYVQDAIASGTSAFITSADLPDLSDMATQTWVGEQGYLTSIPSEYITDTELESAISGKADTSAIPSLEGYATEQYVQDQTSAFITSAELPSEEEVEFEELDLSAYAMASAIPDVSNFVTQEDIDASVSGKMDATESSAFYPIATNPSGYLVSSDLNGYATESYVQSQVSGKADTSAIPSLDGYATQSWVSGQGYLTEVPSQYITESELSTALNGYATESYVQDQTSAFIDSAYVTDYVASQTSGKQDSLTFTYDSSDKISAINGSALAEGGGVSQVNSDWDATSGVAEILNKPDTKEIEFKEVDLSVYALASAIPDTSDMATKTWVNGQGYLTSVPATYVTDSELASAVSGLATKSEVTSGLAAKQNILTGITDVQVVNSLPGSPVSTVLYLIPET